MCRALCISRNKMWNASTVISVLIFLCSAFTCKYNLKTLHIYDLGRMPANVKLKSIVWFWALADFINACGPHLPSFTKQNKNIHYLHSIYFLCFQKRRTSRFFTNKFVPTIFLNQCCDNNNISFPFLCLKCTRYWVHFKSYIMQKHHFIYGIWRSS